MLIPSQSPETASIYLSCKNFYGLAYGKRTNTPWLQTEYTGSDVTKSDCIHHGLQGGRTLASAMTFDATLVDVIGSLAACLTTASFVPQAWLSFKTRDVSGVSLGMYSVFTAGVALWLVYGLLLGAWPIVAANAITLLLAIAILVMKLVYGKSAKSPAAM